MATGDSGGILRQKLARSREAEVAAPRETAARVWRTGFSRAARELAGLPFLPDDIRDERCSLTELLDSLPERAFYAMLEGPGQSLGLLTLSSDFLCALIEAQTLGAPQAQPAAARRFTRTDAALSAAVLDASLAWMDTSLQSSPDLAWAGGFRYASFLEDARPLGLLLEDLPYRLLSLRGALTGTSRAGEALLALPATGRGVSGQAPPPPERPADPLWQKNFAESLGEAEISLMAVIARLRLPLNEARALQPGSLLPLPQASVRAISLLTAGGEQLCEARLGRQGSQRAVKLQTEAAAPTAEAPLPVPEEAESASSPGILRRA